MKAVFGVCVVALLLLVASTAFASAPNGTDRHANAVLAQASPSPSPPTETPTASPSPGEGNEGGISTGAGIVIAAILIGGLLLMRSRLLRR